MNHFNVLFTSSGRRVELLDLFRSAVAELGWTGKIVTADKSNMVATAFMSDVHELVPSVTDENYISTLINICERHNIDLVIPLIDWELSILAEQKNRFLSLGVNVAVSSKAVCDICLDKRQTAVYLQSIGVEAPKTYQIDEINNAEFPLLMKPYNGSASKDVNLVSNRQEFSFYSKTVANWFVQQYVIGQEYAIDGIVDSNGSVVCVVPRRQLEARAGEVSKGRTERNSRLIELGVHVLENLSGAFGCFTMDCIVAEDGKVYFLDINPRFGGGMPLSIRAGANFPRWLLEISAGRELHQQSFEWVDGFQMIRYDQAIYVNENGKNIGQK